MQAILYERPGGADVLRLGEYPQPQPAADEVLIRVNAAGVNRADLMQRQGRYPPPPGTSDLLGLEVAGEVVGLGSSVTGWQKGDRLCALLAGGGYAEYVAVPAAHCLPVPPELSLLEAAALPEALVTVWANLFEAGGLTASQTALVHGGASGIGTTAIKLAKLFGANIFVTVGTEEKAAACRALGVDLVINHATEDFVELIQAATNGRGVDVVVDMVGGDYIPKNLAILAPHGRHVSLATQRGRLVTLDLRMVMQKQLIITGSTLRDRSAPEKARLIRAVREKIWPFVISGALKPLIYRSYPLKNAAEAHKMMESGEHIGKIVLEVDVKKSL